MGTVASREFRHKPKSVRHTIELPELLTIIVLELNTNDQRKLMLVSKHFFRSVGPIAWKRVPGFSIVLKLIKGGKGKAGYFSELNRPVYDRTITLPLKPDLSRYAIYSPWIQELEIFAGYHQEIINLQPFLTLLDGRPPLPNLRRLTTHLYAPTDGSKLMSLIDMFIHSSLIEIRMIIYEETYTYYSNIISRIPSSSVPTLLQKLKETCPGIQVLEFYSEDATHGDPLPQSFTLNDRCRGILPSFLHLRSFSSNTYILMPEIFRIMGELPYLESLGVRGTSTEHSVLDKQEQPPLITETWFPALKDLRLYDVHPGDVKALWAQPGISKKLVSGVIYTDCSELPHRNPPEDFLYDRSWVGPFLAALPGFSPRLQDFALYVGNARERYQIPREQWHHLIADASRGMLKGVVEYVGLGYQLQMSMKFD